MPNAQHETPHNPDGLTPEQVGVADEWRLLTKDENTFGAAIPFTEYWDGYEWCRFRDGKCFGGEEPLRTKLSPAELRAARGLPPISEPAAPARQLPEPLYSCHHCRQEYSWPARDLSWCQEFGAWVCNECWTEAHGEKGETLESAIAAAQTSPKTSSAAEPLVTGTVHKQAQHLLGEVIWHDDVGGNASYGCVEVNHATFVVSSLIAKNNSLTAETTALQKVVAEMCDALKESATCLESALSRLGCQTESAPKRNDADDMGGLACLDDIRRVLSLTPADIADQWVRKSEVERVEKERDELKAWKESMLAVESEWDVRALAKLLGAPLGRSCRKEISERVPALVKERDDLRKHLEKLNTPFEDADPRITIANESYYYIYRVDRGSEVGPFGTWREAYRAAAGFLEYKDLREKLAESEKAAYDTNGTIDNLREKLANAESNLDTEREVRASAEKNYADLISFLSGEEPVTYNLHVKEAATKFIEKLANAERERDAARIAAEVLSSATTCGRCGKFKHTPWRDAEHGYVCAKCLVAIHESDLAAARQSASEAEGRAKRLRNVVEDIYYELDNRYDGADDSTTKWMATHLNALCSILALQSAKGEAK